MDGNDVAADFSGSILGAVAGDEDGATVLA
jgi:hypothetical protein